MAFLCAGLLAATFAVVHSTPGKNFEQCTGSTKECAATQDQEPMNLIQMPKSKISKDIAADPCPWPYPTHCGPALDKYPPYLLGGVFGMAACAGLTQGNNLNMTDVANADCNIQLNAAGQQVTNALSTGQTQGMMCAAPAVSSCNGQNPTSWPVDLNPLHFTWPVKIDNGTATSLDWSDFEFVRSDGSTVQPWAVTLVPQNDGNEGFTVLTATPNLGKVGSPTAGPPIEPVVKTIRIVGSLILTNGTHDFDVQGQEFSGGNEDYMTGSVLVEAWVRSHKSELNPYAEGNDPCPSNTTHVVGAATIGGMSKDGVNAFDSNQFNLFEIKLKDGSSLSKDKFIRLADIDGDDITDVCLSLTDAEALQLDTLEMPCDMSDPQGRYSLPKGINNGKFPCTASQPQKIAQVSCPKSVLCR